MSCEDSVATGLGSGASDLEFVDSLEASGGVVTAWDDGVTSSELPLPGTMLVSLKAFARRPFLPCSSTCLVGELARGLVERLVGELERGLPMLAGACCCCVNGGVCAEDVTREEDADLRAALGVDPLDCEGLGGLWVVLLGVAEVRDDRESDVDSRCCDSSLSGRSSSAAESSERRVEVLGGLMLEALLSMVCASVRLLGVLVVGK